MVDFEARALQLFFIEQPGVRWYLLANQIVFVSRLPVDTAFPIHFIRQGKALQTAIAVRSTQPALSLPIDHLRYLSDGLRDVLIGRIVEDVLHDLREDFVVGLFVLVIRVEDVGCACDQAVDDLHDVLWVVPFLAELYLDAVLVEEVVFITVSDVHLPDFVHDPLAGALAVGLGVFADDALENEGHLLVDELYQIVFLANGDVRVQFEKLFYVQDYVFGCEVFRFFFCEMRQLEMVEADGGDDFYDVNEPVPQLVLQGLNRHSIIALSVLAIITAFKRNQNSLISSVQAIPFFVVIAIYPVFFHLMIVLNRKWFQKLVNILRSFTFLNHWFSLIPSKLRSFSTGSDIAKRLLMMYVMVSALGMRLSMEGGFDDTWFIFV